MSLLLVAVLVALAPQEPAAVPAAGRLTGIVTSARTGAPLHDVQITVVPESDTTGATWPDQALATRTGTDGRFDLPRLPSGPATLTISTIGYIFVRRRIEIPAGDTLDLAVPLAEGTGTYEESVDVVAAPPAMPLGQVRELSSGALQELRGVAADDPVRAVQALPGVATGDDFQAEFSVRGSAYRHVGLVIDGVATPLLFHAVRGAEDTGSIAMLNTDIVSRASLQIGPHPARHGNWLGATLEFDVREGSRDRVAVRGAVSGTNASTVLEGPLTRRRRGSWLVSLRKSYVDWLVRKIDSQIDSTIGFLDAQAKVVYDLTPRQQVQVLVLGGNATYYKLDADGANEIKRATSASTLVSAAWRLAASGALVSQRLSVATNRFRNRGLYWQEQARGDTTNVIWRADLTVPLGAWTMEAGANAERQQTATTLRNFSTATATTTRIRAERASDDRRTIAGGFVGLGGKAAGVGVHAGVRVGHDTLTSSTQASPWVMLDHTAGRVSLAVSASRVVQYPSLDQWAAASLPLTAERAWLLDAGARLPVTSTLGAGVMVFRRAESDTIRRVSENRLDGGTRIVESIFPSVAGSLDGTSRGVDMLIERRAERGPTGWVAYTWAHTDYRDRVTGERFDGDYDQRHTLNVFVQQRLSWRMRVSARFRYGSNFPMVGYLDGEHEALRLGTERNRVRLPAYARLDLSGSRTFTFERTRLTLFVEVMNVTNRDNYGPADGFIRSNLVAANYSEKLLPIVPSAGVLIEF
jgi:hypothetical protein